MRTRTKPTASDHAPGLNTPAKPGVLYVVATPIGNLEDITLRALRILGEVSLILAEDTRVTRKLLSRFNIRTPIASYHAHSAAGSEDAFVSKLVAGDDLALVSDAGTPAISDPGDRLVAAAAQAGIRVVPIPGPSAITAALSISAVAGGRFAFDGFPPRGRSDRRAFFEALRDEPRAMVLYEAPQRLLSTLRELEAALGERDVVVAREITKAFEDIYRGTLSGAVERYEGAPPRGELTIVVHPPQRTPRPAASTEELKRAVSDALGRGLTRADAARSVAASLGVSRRDAYRAVIQQSDDG